MKRVRINLANEFLHKWLFYPWTIWMGSCMKWQQFHIYLTPRRRLLIAFKFESPSLLHDSFAQSGFILFLFLFRRRNKNAQKKTIRKKRISVWKMKWTNKKYASLFFIACKTEAEHHFTWNAVTECEIHSHLSRSACIQSIWTAFLLLSALLLVKHDETLNVEFFKCWPMKRTNWRILLRLKWSMDFHKSQICGISRVIKTEKKTEQ